MQVRNKETGQIFELNSTSERFGNKIYYLIDFLGHMIAVSGSVFNELYEEVIND